MFRPRLFVLVVLWGLVGRGAAAQALNLTVTPNTFSFASADPDTTPVINAGLITVQYRVRNNAGGNWRITLLANGDLVSGPATIPVTNITWTATPAPPFQAGMMSRTVAQTLASGSGNVSPAQTGSLLFNLANSWNYSVGTYSQTFVMTLSAP